MLEAEAIPIVALGCDYNSERANFGIVIGREVREQYLAWRTAEFHYPRRKYGRDDIRNVGLDRDERLALLADSFDQWWRSELGALEPSVIYLERPRGKFQVASMNMFYGALFVALALRFPHSPLWGIEPMQWRSQADLPRSLPKEVSIRVASECFLTAEGEPADYLDEHQAEALLIARTCFEDNVLQRSF